MDNTQKEKLIDNMTANLPVLRTKADLTQARLSEIIGIRDKHWLQLRIKMSWNTFLSCCLVFKANSETSKLLDIYNIVTDELENYLSNNQEASRTKSDSQG